MKALAVLFCLMAGAYCYLPSAKENFLSGIFLRDLVNRINEKENGISYLDLTDMDSRSLQRDLEEEQMFPLDYDALGDISLLHPSIRDQEYLQHSNLWGNQFVSGGAGEGDQILRPQGMLKNKQEVKTDSTLPAYCNPPNPCPVGYTEEQGCITEFENTADFSRRYQAIQDCMCDSEHMFECPSLKEGEMSDDLEFSRIWQKMGQSFPYKKATKKFHHPVENNPFLAGEKLPVAAKKGKKFQ